MKKILIAVVLLFSAISLNAQERWSVGLRVGSAFQADAQMHFNKQYLEARLGLGYINRFVEEWDADCIGCPPARDYNTFLSADFSLFYNWKVYHWSSNVGRVFVDAGVGVNIGGYSQVMYLGPAGMAKVGIKFDSVPIALSLDWSPAFGASIPYGYPAGVPAFNSMGLANFGVTCVYNF